MLYLGRLFLLAFLFCSVVIAYAAEEDEEIADLGHKVESLLRIQKFEELEAMAREFRNPDVRLKGGNSKLYHFYGALGGYENIRSFAYSSHIPFSSKHELIEKWIATNPKSIAAHLAMAHLWLNYGLQARGEKAAKDVSPEQWKMFADRLAVASSHVEELNPELDAHTYLILMMIAKGTSDARKKLDMLSEKAVKSFPNYFHYYSFRANRLQERWFGRKGELASYVQSVLTMPGGDNGLVTYSYITLTLLRENPREQLFREIGLSWVHVQEAYAARGRRYGLRSRDWNVLFYLALGTSDIAAAKEALAQIGTDWYPGIWRERKYFDAAAAWVHAKSLAK